MRVKIGIVAHVDRRDMADALDERVDGDLVAFDSGCLGGKENHLRTWEHMSESSGHLLSADWGVVLEDDAIPCHAFRWELEQALAKAPTPIVSLYLGRSRPEHWQEPIARVYAADVSWLTAPELLHGVGYAVKWNLIPHMVAGARRSDSPAIDTAISEWMKTSGHQVSYSKPSLVNHNDEVTPVVPEDQRSDQVAFIDPSSDIPCSTRRVAWSFGGRDRPWDWTTRAIEPPEVIPM